MESSWAKETAEKRFAIENLDGPFRVARAVALAYEPNLVLPDTLKSQPTDTNKVSAVEALHDIIDDHAGEAWADEILDGELGTQGPELVREIHESIAAHKALAAARDERAKAYGPTYDRFLRFRRVVRSALGPSSPQYRRIRARAAARDDDEGNGNESGGNGARSE